MMALPPPAMSAKAVVSLRQRFGLSQPAFASVLNVSLKTLQSWEQGNRRPSQAALRLLQVAKRRPEMLLEAAQR